MKLNNKFNLFSKRIKKYASSILDKDIKFVYYYLHPKHHKNVGAIVPSSKSLSSSITSKINKQIKGKNILEVGAGTGVFSKAIIKKLNTEDSLDIIEINPTFAKILQKNYQNYTNIRIFNDSILNFKTNKQYDYIISGLPFNYFSAEVVNNILDIYKSLIKANGYISYFEYAFINYFKVSHLKSNKVIKVIKDFKKSFTVSKKLVKFNIPPAVVWHMCNNKLDND